MRLTEFNSLKLIARGGSCFVFTANLNGRKIVIKALATPLRSSREVKAFLQHTSLLCSLKSRYIVRHYFGFLEKGYPRLATELCSYGDLNKLLVKNQQMAPGAAVLLCRQMTEALQYLHDAGIVHSDICSANVLVGSRLSLKLGDLGLARGPGALDEFRKGVGHSRYLPPKEEQEGGSTKETDVFQLGLVFLKILLGRKLPREGPKWEELRNDFVCEDERLGKVVTGMLRRNPKKRMKVGEVKEELKKVHEKLLEGVRDRKHRSELFRINKPDFVVEKELSFTKVDEEQNGFSENHLVKDSMSYDQNDGQNNTFQLSDSFESDVVGDKIKPRNLMDSFE